MIYTLDNSQSGDSASLFAPLADHNLVLGSILAGITPAPIYVDDPQHPKAAFTWFKYRAFLAGNPDSSSFITELANLLRSELISAALRRGIDACILDFTEPAWVNALPQLFPGLQPIQALRQFYVCCSLPVSAAPQLPEGFSLLPVDAVLLARTDLKRITELKEETCSERLSVEDFLAHSFGYCIIYHDELVCWCLSEYNTGDKCEVGVATAEPYQRRSLATIATRALLEHAFRSGYNHVGWHCWSRNTPSGALASRAGFTLEQEHTVYLYPTLQTGQDKTL
jgi:hypothetical protein